VVVGGAKERVRWRCKGGRGRWRRGAVTGRSGVARSRGTVTRWLCRKRQWRSDSVARCNDAAGECFAVVRQSGGEERKKKGEGE